jgi:hypothetical protein
MAKNAVKQRVRGMTLEIVKQSNLKRGNPALFF